MKRRLVIVGAGLAGVTLANRVESVFNVTVIEKGGRDSFSTPDLNDYKLAAVPTLAYGQGGTTNLWHNGLIKPSLKSIKGDKFRSKLELLSDSGYIDEAARELGYKEELEFSSSVDHREHIFEGLLGMSLNCIYYPDKVTILKLNPEVEAFYNSTVESVNTDDKTLGLTDAFGVSRLLNYDVLIIASGGIGSIKVLQNSGLLSPKRAFFIDHPMGFLAKIKVKKEFEGLFQQLHSDGSVFGHFKAVIPVTIGDYTSAVYVRPAQSLVVNSSISKYKSLLGASSGLRRLKSLMSPKILHPDILSEIFYKLTKRTLNKRVYSLMFVGEQRLFTNTIKCDEVSLVLNADELDVYKKQLDLLEDELKPFCEVFNKCDDITPDDLWSAAHHSGSVANTKALDENLRLVGYEDIYVCDASVLPEHSYFNTGLVIAAFALNLGDELIRKWQ